MPSPSPDLPEIRLVVSARPRQAARVDPVPWPGGDDPTAAAVVAVAGGPAWGVTLSGGEPTTRADLPALIAALRDAGRPGLGIATDGAVLGAESAARTLRGAGLERVRLALHSGRPDAHDWLAGAPGLARRVRRAAAVCAAAGLRIEIDAVITRSTLPLAEETVEIAAALGASAVRLYRYRAGSATWADAVALSPRLGLAPPYLEAAVRAGERRGLAVTLHGFPACAAPAVDAARARPGAEVWRFPGDERWAAAAAAVDPGHVRGCATCPPDCPGAPADYVALFGRTELASVGSPPEPAERRDDRAPPPRAGWRPATRVEPVRARARGTARPGSGAAPADVLEVPLDPTEPSRAARLRLVRAAQERPAVLRLVGGWAEHPDGAVLIAETRLFGATTEVDGAIDRLGALTDRALGRLDHLARVWAPLRGRDDGAHDAAVGRPGALSATRALVPRLSALGIGVAPYAEVRDADEVRAWLAAWEAGAVPGPAAFRLAPSADRAGLAAVDHDAVRAALADETRTTRWRD